jgi:hypothetical protein
MSDSTAEPTTKIQPLALPVWLLPVLIVLGIAAGIASEPVIDANRERFFTATGLPPFPPALLWKVFRDNVYNHSICYGFVGFITCALFSLVSGSLRSPGKAIQGLLLGAIVGVVSGAILGTVGWYWSDKILVPIQLDSIINAFLIFIPFWFCLSMIAAALALFLNGRLGNIGKVVRPAFIYSSIATFVYVAIVTMGMPGDWPGRIIPEFARVRIVLEVVGCVAVAMTVYKALRVPSSQPTTEVA